MLIGILSDTHGRIEATRAAIDALRGRGAEFLIHCGDVGSQGILDLMVGVPSAVVWGNTDYDHVDLARHAGIIGVAAYGQLANLELAGKKIAVTHGDNHRLMRQIETAQEHDYLLHGHTHAMRDQRVARTRIINPGAVHRASTRTVALLNLADDRLRFLTLSG